MVVIILLTYVLWVDGALVLSNNVLWGDVALRLLICVLLMTQTCTYDYILIYSDN
jgi:hypothetical protein